MEEYMRKFLISSVAAAALSLGSSMAFAATVMVEPDVDTWVMSQPEGPAVTVDGDIVVGGTLPGTVQVMEVPKYSKYSYVVVNKKRVLIDNGSRKIIKVY
jgi:hypothetical protein